MSFIKENLRSAVKKKCKEDGVAVSGSSLIERGFPFFSDHHRDFDISLLAQHADAHVMGMTP